MGHHIMVPKEGVAVHINLQLPHLGHAGEVRGELDGRRAAVVKPATVTSYLTEAMVKAIVESGILPEGAIQLIAAAPATCWTMGSQDVVTFTGSASTSRRMLKARHIIAESVPFNMEADSLNSIVLEPDATPDTEEFTLFIKEVGRDDAEVRTALHRRRRIMVPENLVEDVRAALGKRLGGTVIGDPRAEGCAWAPWLADPAQEVRDNPGRTAEGQRAGVRRPGKRGTGYRSRRRAPS